MGSINRNSRRLDRLFGIAFLLALCYCSHYVPWLGLVLLGIGIGALLVTPIPE